MLSLPIGCMKFLFPKLFCHHFAHKKLKCNELELILKLSPNYLSRRLKTSYFGMEMWTRKDSSNSDIPAERPNSFIHSTEPIINEFSAQGLEA
jgi:hypothetical protein